MRPPRLTTTKTVVPSSASMRVSKIAWKQDGSYRAELKDDHVLLTNIKTNESFKIPLKYWDSFLVFLAQSFVTLESQINNLNRLVHISLEIDPLYH